jgi:hypothetical protein
MKTLFTLVTVLLLSLTACQTSGEGQENQAGSEAESVEQIKTSIKSSLDSIMVVRDSLFNVRIALLKTAIDADPLLAMKVAEFDGHDDGLRSNMEQFQMVVNNYENGTFDFAKFESMAKDRKELALTYLEKMKLIGLVYFNPDIPN